MEVLSCSDVQYVGESDCAQKSSGTNLVYSGEPNCLEHGKQVQISDVTHKVDNFVVNAEWPQKDRLGEDQGRVDGSPPLDKEEGQELPCYFHDSQKENSEPCMASQSLYTNVDKIEGELPNNDWDGESCLPEAEWSEQDEAVAMWVKWRGKWQAGIRCARADCPLSTLKARPTHERKKYFVVFFPQTRNYSWADTLLVRPIHEFPEPIAHRTHYRGLKKVKDLSLPRRFIMQKLAVGMVNLIDQLHNEAVIESARKVEAWKEFAMEASCCKHYSDLGRMLLKLQSMILQCYVDPDWLQHSFDSWANHCQNAQSAESVEMLKEELVTSVLWNNIEALWDDPVQPELDSEWKTWKQEIMKWFSISHPIATSIDVEQKHTENSMNAGIQIIRKRPKLEVRRAEVHVAPVEPNSHEVQPQGNTGEIDSGFFNSPGLGNAITLVSEPGIDRWDGIVVEAGNNVSLQTTQLEETPIDGGNGMKPLDPTNKNRQCMAFVEAKGRQCVRWANEGDVFCCVHLAVRSLGKTVKMEQTPHFDAPMCEGTTTHGTKCKHRSLYGYTFCKKHRRQNSQYLMDIEKLSSSPGNTHKRNHNEMISTTETSPCKEIILIGEVQNPVQENSISVMEEKTLDGGHNLVNSAEFLHCIGLCHQNTDDPCQDRAKLHALYCEKHLPSFLKRARNGKSRIISKEVFIDLLRNCKSCEQKLHLHRACVLLHSFMKNFLSHRNPVPKETQLQWFLSEASKDLCVGECLMKLVFREKDKLMKLWDFDIVPHAELSVPAPASHQSSYNTHKPVKCKLCSGTFSDEQVLGTHWIDVHKKEAQLLFRGYACAICLDSFTNKKVLGTHVTERHEVQFLKQCILFQCIPCACHFNNAEQFWLHVVSVHSKDFKLPTVVQQLELGNNYAPENNSGSKDVSRRFICRFCGLKFDLLPDLGRHHQSAHMGPNSISNISQKRGSYLNSYKLKSNRLDRRRFSKNGLGGASYRIRNRGNMRMRKRFQESSLVDTGGVRVETQVTEMVGLGRLADSECSAVAKILFSEIQRAKPRPSNLDILSVARSTCCKVNIQAVLEKQFGLLPERLYLKAAKLCSELNIQVDWHQEGFICPKGCKPIEDPHILSPLTPLPSGFVELKSATSADPMSDEELEMDECHYIIESQHIKLNPSIKVVLFEDVSNGRESVPVACVVDGDLIGSLHSVTNEASNGERTGSPMPWMDFSYVRKRLLDPSLGRDTQSMQLGCACSHPTCSPEACDHVYLFDNDFENAKDIYGKPMLGKFPYDENGRMILEEGYPVYECNSRCRCDRSCRNRVLQNGVQAKLEIFKTEKKGWAVRACEAISRGTFVCEYIGEVLNEQEANKRGLRHYNEGCAYLYGIDPIINDTSEQTEVVRYMIDGTRYGNVSRFINHSCSPNLVSYQVLMESMDCQLAHIGLYASCDIGEGEELAYDYSNKIQSGGHPCHCGAPNCRGRLP